MDEHPDLAALGRLPEQPGQVEHAGLEEEEEADPLVVLVVLDLLALLEVAEGRDAGVRDVLALLAGPPGGDGEGGVDPAVGVHDAAGDAVDDAVDGVADVLAGGHQERGEDEHDHGALEDIEMVSVKVMLKRFVFDPLSATGHKFKRSAQQL